MTRPQGGTYWRLTGEEYQDDGYEDTVSGEKVEATSDQQLQAEGPDGEAYRIDHSTHNRGWVADIRPMVGSEEEVGHPLAVEADATDRTIDGAVGPRKPRRCQTDLLTSFLRRGYTGTDGE